jgi:hypothetical protein
MFADICLGGNSVPVAIHDRRLFVADSQVARLAEAEELDSIVMLLPMLIRFGLRRGQSETLVYVRLQDNRVAKTWRSRFGRPVH